jgi:hypothetical protein
MTEGQLGLIISGSAVIGGAVYRLAVAAWTWFRSDYVPLDEVKQQRFDAWKKDTERDLTELRAAILTHLKLCEETPNKLILAEIENLTNILHAQKAANDRVEGDVKEKIIHISRELQKQWGIIEQFRKEQVESREEQANTLKQILKAITERKD